MSTFLETILHTKAHEVAALRERRDAEWRQRLKSLPPCRGFAEAIQQSARLAVIAEVKQASPSKGQIATAFDPVAIAQRYERAGASAVSVLTDRTYFRGSLDDLRHIRQAIQLPLLRKDFIIDEIQVEEARLAGADAVLLICAALTPERLTQLAAYARDLGLDVLIEIHSEAELESALRAGPAVLGINNRDLHSFEVSLSVSERLLSQIPAGRTAIAESGIHTAEDARRMADAGARGILVGESLMKRAHTGELEALLDSFRAALPASQPAVNGP